MLEKTIGNVEDSQWSSQETLVRDSGDSPYWWRDQTVSEYVEGYITDPR